MRRVRFLLPLLLLALSPLGRAQIYADVSTSMGAFTVQLNHTASPRTVANFMTLAQGTRAWIDDGTGAIHTNEPFYNGITFHRVVKDAIIQAGSRKGDGSDGPGYEFRDELNNGLAHSGPYVVSMANKGTNTNGSQFFITDVALPGLDGKHTVFGIVSSGQNIVEAINNVPTTNEKPNTPVVIQSVAIRRVGASAIAFNEHGQLLPEVTARRIQLAVQPGGSAGATISPALEPRTMIKLFRSTILTDWSFLGESYLTRDDPADGELAGIEQEAPGRAFYHLPTVRYPDDPTFSNHALATYQVTYATQTRSYQFNAQGTGGTVTITPSGGNPTQLPFTVMQGSVYEPYLAQLIMDHGSTASPRYLRHTFHSDSGSGNTCGGRLTSDQFFVNTWFSWNSGTFTATR
jgi:peptidyl-prolyl cis-trans isomerase A (cyclophilin A)